MREVEVEVERFTHEAGKRVGEGEERLSLSEK